MGDEFAGSTRPSAGRLGLRLAGSWSAVFAGVHVYWALGGAAGLAESAGVELASTRPGWFVGVGLWGVAGVLVVAATGLGVLAHLPARGYPLRPWRLAFQVIALTGALLLLRGLVLELALLLDVDGLASAVGPEQTRWSLLLWNPWFIAGGAAFLVGSTGQDQCGRDRGRASASKPSHRDRM